MLYGGLFQAVGIPWFYPGDCSLVIQNSCRGTEDAFPSFSKFHYHGNRQRNLMVFLEKHFMSNEFAKSSEVDVLRRIIEGDTDAFSYIVDKYWELILRIVKKRVPKKDIEDVSQNAFLRIYQSLGMFKGKGSFKGWLSSIAVRTCYDYWRKAYQSHEIPMNALTEKQQKWLENTISDLSETELAERGKEKEAAELLEWALCKLSAKDRMVMELIYLEGYSGKETAELLGWSVSNVKVRSFRLKKKLKSILTAAKKTA